MALIPVLMGTVPNLISLKHLAGTVTITARDPELDMIATRGINPKILENAKLPDRIRLMFGYGVCVSVCPVKHQGGPITMEDLKPQYQFPSCFLSLAVSLRTVCLMPGRQSLVHLGHIYTTASVHRQVDD